MSAALVCAGIGAAALGYNAFLSRKGTEPQSACASARVASHVDDSDDLVSAKRAIVETSLDDEEMWGLSEEGVKQFESYGGNTQKDPNSEAVKKAKLELKAQYVDSKLNKDIGTLVPRIGCAVEPVPPKVTGGLWFGQSEAYANAVDADSM